MLRSVVFRVICAVGCWGSLVAGDRARTLAVEAADGAVQQLSAAELEQLESPLLSYIYQELGKPIEERALLFEQVVSVPSSSLQSLQMLLFSDEQFADRVSSIDAAQLADLVVLADYLLIKKRVYQFVKAIAAQGRGLDRLCRAYHLLEGHDPAQRLLDRAFAASAIPVITRYPVAGTIESLALSANGSTLVAACGDSTAVVWSRSAMGDLTTQETLGVAENTDERVGHLSWLFGCAITDDAQRIVTTSGDHTAIVWHKDQQGKWNIQQRLGRPYGADPAEGHIDQVYAVAITPDASVIVTSSADHTLIVWQRGDDGRWRLAQRLSAVRSVDARQGHTSEVYGIAMTPDGSMIASTSFDRSVIIWRRSSAGRWYLDQRLADLAAARSHEGSITWLQSAALSVDGTTLAAASSDYTAYVWKQNAHHRWTLVQQLGVPYTKDPALGHVKPVGAVVISPHADTIVTGSMDRTALVWQQDAQGRWVIRQRLGALMGTMPEWGHTHQVSAVLIDPAADSVITGSYDRSVIVWRQDSLAARCGKRADDRFGMLFD